MTQSVSFNSIPLTINTPGHFHEFDGSKAVKGLPAIPHVALIVAPRLSTGTANDLTPFLISSPAVAELGFGRHSIGSFMGKAFKGANKFTELWGIGVADAGGGVAAAGVLTFSGVATAAGTIPLYIAGIRIPIAVTVGMTAAQVVTAVAAEITSGGYELPVTGADGTGDTVDIVAKNKGTTGNAIDLRFCHNDGELIPAGLTATVTTAMTGGATDGAVASAIAAMSDTQFHTVVSAWDLSANLALFEAELLDRWGPMEQKAGHLFAGVKGSQGTMTSAGNARNSFNSTLIGTGLSPTPTYVFASVLAAVDALQTSIDPFRPRTGLPLKGCVAPRKASVLTRSERDTLLSDGVSTYTVDPAGNVLIERVITTYQTTSSVADRTYMDITTVRGLDALRYTQNSRIALKFPRHKLAGDETEIPPGQAIVQPKTIKSELIALAKEWQRAGWIENIDQYIEDLIVVRSSSDPNRVDILQSPDLINAFLVSATNTQFLL